MKKPGLLMLIGIFLFIQPLDFKHAYAAEQTGIIYFETDSYADVESPWGITPSHFSCRNHLISNYQNDSLLLKFKKQKQFERLELLVNFRPIRKTFLDTKCYPYGWTYPLMPLDHKTARWRPGVIHGSVFDYFIVATQKTCGKPEVGLRAIAKPVNDQIPLLFAHINKTRKLPKGPIPYEAVRFDSSSTDHAELKAGVTVKAIGMYQSRTLAKAIWIEHKYQSWQPNEPGTSEELVLAEAALVVLLDKQTKPLVVAISKGHGYYTYSPAKISHVIVTDVNGDNQVDIIATLNHGRYLFIAEGPPGDRKWQEVILKKAGHSGVGGC